MKPVNPVRHRQDRLKGVKKAPKNLGYTLLRLPFEGSCRGLRLLSSGQLVKQCDGCTPKETDYLKLLPKVLQHVDGNDFYAEFLATNVTMFQDKQSPFFQAALASYELRLALLVCVGPGTIIKVLDNGKIAIMRKNIENGVDIGMLMKTLEMTGKHLLDDPGTTDITVKIGETGWVTYILPRVNG